MSSFTMLPPDLVYREEAQEQKMAHLIRECHSNAENYKATDALILMVYKDGYDYLLYLHNGQPFTDLENDILVNGCIPNVSGQQGKSFQGAGLVASACAVHTSPYLIVGSKINNSWKVGVGTQQSNRWVVRDETQPWAANLTQLVGPEHLKEYNVVYGFRMHVHPLGSRDEDARTMFNPQIMNMVAYMTEGGLTNLRVHFCEQELGWPYKKMTKDGTMKKKDKYASYDSATKKNQTGSVHRRALSHKGYRERFLEKSWTIPCKPFKVLIPTYNDTILPVEKARIVVDYYPAKTDGSSWHLNLRSGTLDGPYSEGKQNEFGTKPTRKAFLYCPWIYEWAKKNEKDFIHYSRFADNSVGTYPQIGRLIGEMNLPYNDYKHPFLVVQVFLDDFGPLPNMELTPHLLFGILQRKSDFTFAATFAINKIMKAAAAAAAENVPEDLKKLCDDLYKSDITDYIPLDLEDTTTRKNHTRQKNVVIFNLVDGKPFDGEFNHGQNYHLALIDRTTGKALNPKDVQIHPMTRGVEIVDLTDTIRHINQKCEANLLDLEKNLAHIQQTVKNQVKAS
ncbi:hypothetical protein [Nitrospira sp. BLG_2]|uniref:hypothetical protein n=1 Tax=Nitrospira sp. BLG_2 TaxID=3397507 RepID=UPI003B9A25F0